MTLGRWWHAEGDRFVCDLCPRRCAMQPGQRGACWVRGATEAGVESLTWGRSSGFCVDPIEKKPLHHFLPGTAVLSFGTAGCNLACRFCQNHDISRVRDDDRLQVDASPEAIADAAVRAGCRSVAFTYNDPVIFAEYALDVAAACRDRGLRSVAVTAGFITDEARADFFDGMDAANVDLKAFTDDFYRRLCAGRLEPVLDTLRHLAARADVWLEVTTLLIPGANDGDAELGALCDWYARELGPDVPLHFTAYHPDHRWDAPATPPSTLQRARSIAQRAGLRFVYLGNVRYGDGAITRCPACAAAVVRRDGYQILDFALRGGRCACGAAIPGVWEDAAGSWGARRLPIALR